MWLGISFNPCIIQYWIWSSFLFMCTCVSFESFNLFHFVSVFNCFHLLSASQKVVFPTPGVPVTKMFGFDLDTRRHRRRCANKLLKRCHTLTWQCWLPESPEGFAESFAEGFAGLVVLHCWRLWNHIPKKTTIGFVRFVCNRTFSCISGWEEKAVTFWFKRIIGDKQYNNVPD